MSSLLLWVNLSVNVYKVQYKIVYTFLLIYVFFYIFNFQKCLDAAKSVRLNAENITNSKYAYAKYL